MKQKFKIENFNPIVGLFIAVDILAISFILHVLTACSMDKNTAANQYEPLKTSLTNTTWIRLTADYGTTTLQFNENNQVVLTSVSINDDNYPYETGTFFFHLDYYDYKPAPENNWDFTISNPEQLTYKGNLSLNSPSPFIFLLYQNGNVAQWSGTYYLKNYGTQDKN